MGSDELLARCKFIKIGAVLEVFDRSQEFLKYCLVSITYIAKSDQKSSEGAHEGITGILKSIFRI